GRAGADNSLELIIEGKGNGTYFGHSTSQRLRAKKQWIAFHATPSGQIVIDGGAVTAIVEGRRSLLPVGVRDVSGKFKAGEVVEVLSNEGTLIGKGIVNYSTSGLKRVLGKSLSKIKF